MVYLEYPKRKGAERMTEAERQDTKKAMAFDLLQILKEKPEQTTYTAAEIEKIICVYVKTSSQQ